MLRRPEFVIGKSPMHYGIDRDSAAVRYDRRNTPDRNVFKSEGLPALRFRIGVPSAFIFGCEFS